MIPMSKLMSITPKSLSLAVARVSNTTVKDRRTAASQFHLDFKKCENAW